MLDKVLSTRLREQAGADTYNRFEYQVYWVVYHMIKEYKKGKEFLILCEFHDDMVKSECVDNPTCLEFYQIKTTATKKQWKIKDLFKVDKKTHSFLGFIFYNFMNFSSECNKCHFVSNIGVNKEICEWQSVIEDGKNLKEENPKLYEQIKEFVRNEYNEYEQAQFNYIFDKFIQNTYVYNGDLPLEQYEKIIRGEFLELLEDKDIYVSISNKILRDIIENVRKKSKTKINTPISLKSLKEKKAISSNIFKVINNKMVGHIKKEDLYNDIELCLEEYGKKIIYRRAITRTLKNHHSKILDVSNGLYIDTCNKIENIIDGVIRNEKDNLEEKECLDKLVIKIKESCNEIIKEDYELDNFLVEALLYENLLSR